MRDDENFLSDFSFYRFPGGRLDAEDKSVEDAVLRETFEEIGIPAHDIEIWNKIVSEKEVCFFFFLM